MKKIILTFLIGIVFFSQGCKPKGCTDSNALNKDYDAKKDDGSCTFSKVIFYVSGFPNFPPLTLYINGSSQGIISGVYPSGPGNCTASGCPTFQFTNGKSVDWEVRDAVNNVINGTVSPNSISECIKVRVY